MHYVQIFWSLDAFPTGLQEQFHAVLTAFEILSCRLGFDFFEVAGRCVSFLTVIEIDIQYNCSTY